MMKIRTLIESLKEGHEKAFKSLDRKVEFLCEVEIIDIKDNIYPIGYGLEQDGATHIERIVVYKEKKKSEGKKWGPTIDMDLMEFLNVSNSPGGVENIVKKAYNHGKKTIRELIAMPYGWFLKIDAIKEYRGGGDSWSLLQKELKKYGFKLYKTGYVIKN